MDLGPNTSGIAMVVLGPPVLTFLFWFGRRRWTLYQQVGELTQNDKRRQRIEAWVLLACFYLGGFIIAGIIGYLDAGR